MVYIDARSASTAPLREIILKNIIALLNFITSQFHYHETIVPVHLYFFVGCFGIFPKTKNIL